MGKKQFCFFQTAETGNRTPDSGVKGSGANHYPRAPALGPAWQTVDQPASSQRWVNASCLMGRLKGTEYRPFKPRVRYILHLKCGSRRFVFHCHLAKTRSCVGLMMEQRCRRWPDVKTTLCQTIVFAGSVMI